MSNLKEETIKVIGSELVKIPALKSEDLTKIMSLLSSKLDEIEKEVIVKDDLLETAWGIICNVSEGDLTKQNAEWHNAFERYREEYFKTLATTPPSKLSEKN